MEDYDRCLEILAADYGTCYTIGNYQLCPEKKLIRVGRMFGTALIDAFGYFPEPSLKYDEAVIVIFAGNAFIPERNAKIDWRTVRLLSYDDGRGEFTDGRDLYVIKYGDVEKRGRFDENSYRPPECDDPAERIFPEDWTLTDEGESTVDANAYTGPKRTALGRQRYVQFYVKDNVFCHDGLPIFEPFDVPNLRTIVSKDGFVTDYITDGNKVLYGGPRGGYSIIEKGGKEYVSAKELTVGGVDMSSLRVLGEDMLADKNALYCRTNVIPFDKLDGFRFILRDM